MIAITSPAYTLVCLRISALMMIRLDVRDIGSVASEMSTVKVLLARVAILQKLNL